MSTDLKGSSSHPLPQATQKFLLFILAAVQFSHILDFMLIMPLGPRLMRELEISPQQFGLLVSAYTLSACGMGIVGALGIDRFDRKNAFLLIYAGFTLGTVLCGMANSFETLLLARSVAGGFGGILTALTLAIVGDSFPEHKRGAAMGILMSSFSLASVLGVPTGLWIANHWSWQAPFLFLGGVSALLFALALYIMPSMKSHLVAIHKKNAFKELIEVAFAPASLKAFLFTIVLMGSGFLLIPYLSTHLVANVKIKETELPYVYLFGGFATLISSPIVGKISDKFGKPRVFVIASIISTVPILAVSHLQQVPLGFALCITSLFMVANTARMIPAQTMLTATVEPAHRGSFMSLNGSFQSLATGLGALLSGAILVPGSEGSLLNYNIVGMIAAVALVVSIFLSRTLKPASA
jgi:predicted MFS family arabinose efflux permease